VIQLAGLDDPEPDEVDAGVEELDEPAVLGAVDDGVGLEEDELSDDELEELEELDESLAGVLAVRDVEPPRLSVL
jgi:hypothetical protein